MRILLVILLPFIADQGLATAIGNRVKSLVGKKLSSSMAIIAEINKVDEFGRNALHHAITLGDLSLVEFFLDNGADTRATDNDGLIPLRYAERVVEEQPSVERLQIASLVLEKTRGINKGDEKGWPPMVWSLMAGDYARVIELRDRGADIFAGRLPWPNPNGQLAGHQNAVWAAEYLKDDRAIKILVKDAPDEYFPTAINNGYQKFVRAMIARGVDVNVKDKYRYSAAMRAAKAGRLKDLQMLIDHGARIDTDVLLWAIYSANPKLIKMIIDYDASLVPRLAIYQTMYGSKKYGMPHLDDLLAKNSKSKGGRRINQMLETAKAGMPVLPTTTIDKLKKLRDTELKETKFGLKTIDGKTTIKRYSSSDNLFKVAVHQGLEQQTRQLLDYLSATPMFLTYVKSAFDNTRQWYHLEPEDKQMLLDNLVKVMNNWQPQAKDQPQLLAILRIVIEEKHHAAIEVVVEKLNNDGAVVYQELLRGLALATKEENKDLAELLLKRAVIASIDEKKLIDHAELLKKNLIIDIIRHDPNPTGQVLLHAIKQNDRETIQQLINFGIEIDNHLLELIIRVANNPELVEFLIDQQIISLETVDGIESYNPSILQAAANSSNFPIIEKMISLGGKSGLNEALLEVAFRTTYTESRDEYAEFEEKVLVTMKLLIEAGAKVAFTDEWGISPLTQAIESLQPSRVEFLLEQGGVAGMIDYTLNKAGGTVKLFRNKEKRIVALDSEKNLAEIKQLLVDKGLVQL